MFTLQRLGRLAAVTVMFGLVTVCLGGRPAEPAGEKNTKFPQHVLIIRHAEKNGDKEDVHLSGAGKERALVLHRLFVATPDRPEPFPTPDFIFAACHHKDSQRPTETVTPLAMKLKLPIIDRFDSKLPASTEKNGEKAKAPRKEGAAELRDELFGSSKYYGKTILISWRHSTISELAGTLKARDVPQKWKDEVFDRVWQISYDDAGNATFRDRPQRLLHGDADK